MGRRRLRFEAAPGTVLIASVGSDARQLVFRFGPDGALEFDEDDQEPVGELRAFARHPRHPEITESVVTPREKKT